MTKKPLTRKSERSKNLLSLICSDVYGPMMIRVICGYTYFITFINEHSIYGYVYLMKYMFEPFKRFKEFTSEIEKQIGNSIKII
jgi:hypothetical protein